MTPGDLRVDGLMDCGVKPHNKACLREFYVRHVECTPLRALCRKRNSSGAVGSNYREKLEPSTDGLSGTSHG